MKVSGLALCGVLLASAGVAQAGTTVVDLNAGQSNPNAGRNSGTYAYNPKTLSLGAGTYTVGVIGTAGGGLYNAYTVYADNGSNAAWTDSGWSVSFNNGASAAYTQANLGRSNTAAGALATYSAASPYTFTLAGTTTVSFYVDDTAYPNFGDDSGGVSLAVSTVAVPEPASLALLGLGVIGAAFATRRRMAASAA